MKLGNSIRFVCVFGCCCCLPVLNIFYWHSVVLPLLSVLLSNEREVFLHVLDPTQNKKKLSKFDYDR